MMRAGGKKYLWQSWLGLFHLDYHGLVLGHDPMSFWQAVFIQSWKDDNRGLAMFAIQQWDLNLCQVCFTYMFVVSLVCRHSIHSLGSSWCMMCLVMPSWKWCWVPGDYFLLSELDSFGRPSYALYLWLDLWLVGWRQNPSRTWHRPDASLHSIPIAHCNRNQETILMNSLIRCTWPVAETC